MGPSKSTSHGKPAYLNEIVVTDLVTHKPLAPNVRGEVMCRGAVVFDGYWNNADATSAAFRDGWFSTGNIGYLAAAILATLSVPRRLYS